MYAIHRGKCQINFIRKCSTLQLFNQTANVRMTSHRGAFVWPFLQWNSIKYYIFWVCVCRFRYPTCNAHAPFCHLWPAPLYNTFPTLSHKRYDFWEKKIVTEHKMRVLIFCTNFVRTVFHSDKNWARYDQNIYIGLLIKYRLFWPDFNETWIFVAYLKKK